jgi:molybdenum cofactor cytidylyltransferase
MGSSVNAKYAAIVLAGGFSTRMQRFKPLLPLGDATVTDRVTGAFFGVGVAVFLVAGYRHDDIAAGINNRDITIVYNPDYAKGMFSSIQAGVRRLGPEYKAFFVNPVDIPLVRPATLKRLIDAAAENPDRIIYPAFLGKRGHPPLIPSELIPGILKWDKNGGLKAVLKAYEKLALEVPMPDSFILFDIDTPENYQALLERFLRCEVPTNEECRALFEIYQVPPDRVRHSYKVADVAVAIGRALDAAGHNVDVEVVRVASVLHDIAKGRIKHDIAGGDLLRELGFGKVADIVAVHSDLAGGDLGLPLESKVVYLADKLVGGEKLVSLEERYRHPDFPPEAQAAVAARLKVAQFVKKEMETLIGRPLESIVGLTV